MQGGVRGGGGVGGSNTPPPLDPNFFLLLPVRVVGHLRGYPYPVSGKLTQLFFFFLGGGKKNVSELLFVVPANVDSLSIS